MPARHKHTFLLSRIDYLSTSALAIYIGYTYDRPAKRHRVASWIVGGSIASHERSQAHLQATKQTRWRGRTGNFEANANEKTARLKMKLGVNALLSFPNKYKTANGFTISVPCLHPKIPQSGE
jgi:hypothetical protein